MPTPAELDGMRRWGETHFAAVKYRLESLNRLMETARRAKRSKPRPKVDTPYKGSWAESMKTQH